ncbi:MAG TPA: patatin-like phospholipase family protein, partial [Myxococcales bacterium]|nr:patatin-like phospholipase family protein [Myxococcales bacterium]
AASPPRGRIAITISGGVSLGSYEAGLAWAFIRYLRASDRAADLAAVTGASAGAANALMAAAMWCEDKAETRDDDPDKNLFHELWAPVGLEDLLPDDRSAFSPTDAVLTAAPLERAFQRVRAELFAPTSVRFRPGCAVSVGLTVTRDRPEERTVAGLRARVQRFVIPWRFEVDAAGQPRIVSAPVTSNRDTGDAQLVLAEPRGGLGIGALQMSQAALASGAFPFAFRPRQLCDCALRCPEEEVVRDGVCEGPDFGQRITSLSCDSISPAGSRQVCKRSYIDGGIFDNAPIGLAVDLAEGSAMAVPFAPTGYIFVDPDHRRLSPAGDRPGASNLAVSAQLITNLIGTARESELARAIRDERWQRTTQSTLSELAQMQGEAAAIQEEMARVAGASGAEPTRGDAQLLRSPRREALGSYLLRCLGELGRAVNQPGDLAAEQFADCAEPLRAGTVGAGERHARPSPEQVARLASALANVLASSMKRGDEILAALSSSSTPFDRQLQLLAIAHDVSTIAITSYRFLIGEIPGIAASGLGEQELVELRRNLLTVAGSGGRLFRATSAMLRVLLLATLLEEQMEGTLPARAAAARAAIIAGADPNLESGSLREVAVASERIGRLVALAPRLRTLSARAAKIESDAAQLSASNLPERQLVLSRRFSPLGGGALLNFSGFLDRPLRDLDFYSGVYDAVVQIASRQCELQGPYPMGNRVAPLFRADAPLMLDPSAEDTQRCLGQSLREIIQELQLGRSARAAFVIARLSRLEVTAQLGSRSVATQLLAEPAWNWLREPELPAGDQLGPALAAVTARTAPCHEIATESLCLVDPTIDELLDALKQAGYVPSSPAMREALSDRERWIAHLAERLVDRAAAVEISSSRRAARAPSSVLLTGVGLGQLWARRAERLTGSPEIDFDPSTIPARSPDGASAGWLVAAHVVPYRISLDVVRGGAAFSWFEPALRLSSSFSINSVADLLVVEGSGRLASALGVIPTVRIRGFALGAGTQVFIPWNADSVLA